MTIRAAIYARFSSDLQNPLSNEDQKRLCLNLIADNDWSYDSTHSYSDADMSGYSMIQRNGLQSMLNAAQRGEFDVVVIEALDRLSRDQADTPTLFKKLTFFGVKIFSIAEGEIDELKVGFKGTMNALFLKDLGLKTHRGLSSKIAKGKSAGGLGYGYKVVKHFDANGEPIKGDQEIDTEQAETVQRIFGMYANDNISPRKIAFALNEEGIPAPSGGKWTQSTINGNRKRGTGILNNELYIGERVWNRQSFPKNPATGKRVTRLNDEKEWMRHSVPELRIIPQDLWDKVKAKQKQLDKHRRSFSRQRRPEYLLSGLLKCGSCGGGFSKLNTERYGCSNARNKGDTACANRKTIKRTLLEDTFLIALQTHLMREELIEVYAEEYTKHLNKIRADQNRAAQSFQKELAKLNKERQSLIQAIKDGISADLIKDELELVTHKIEVTKSKLEDAGTEVKPFIHPAMAKRYQEQIVGLKKALNDPSAHKEAMEYLRMLVDKVVLTPEVERRDLRIDLHGDLAGIISIATEGGKEVRTEKKLRAVNDNLYITGAPAKKLNLLAASPRYQ